MRGSGTSFDPDGKLTRAMFAAVLYRAFGGKAGSAAVFGDVDDPSTWYYDAVNWAAARGYVKGSGGQFLPGAPITRQDMAVILEDLIKLLDGVSNSLRRGRYPDDKHARQIAAVLRAVAEDLDA